MNSVNSAACPVSVPGRPVDIMFERLLFVISGVMVFLYIAEVPKFAGLPASPRFVFLLLAFVMFLLHRKDLVKEAVSSYPRAMVAFLALILAVGAGKGSLRDMIAPVENVMVFTVVFAVMSFDRARAVRMTGLVAGTLVLSSLWMIGSIFLHEPFMTIRRIVYGSQAANFALGYLTLERPTGLAFNHFIMGYQVTAGFILTSLVYLSKRPGKRTLWLAGMLVMLAGVVFAAQRSAVVGIMAALGVYIVLKKRMRLLLFLALAGVAAWYIIQVTHEERADARTVYSHYRKTRDVSDRLTWQLAGLRTVAENPLGNILGELDWEDEALENGADFSYYGGEVQGVHNSYLGRMISYGWPGGLLVLGVLYVVYRRLLPRLFAPSADPEARAHAEAAGLAFIGLSVQALFHNSSMFTFEPTSWVLFAMVCAWARIAGAVPGTEATG